MKYENDSPEVQKAYQMAKKAQENAYAPYSRYQVGAALKLANEDKYVSGCNVENASYGGTVCAERTAIFSQIAQNGKKEIDLLVVVTNDDPPAPPCAFCLQVITEFCHPETPIFLGDRNSIAKKYLLNELLPHPFIFKG